MSQRIHFGKIYNESNRPFDISSRVTYNLGRVYNSMDKALQTVAELLTNPIAQAHRPRFKRIREMPGADSLFERIASAKDKETLHDYFAEITYALVFAGLGFEVEIEPSGKEGPDQRVSRDGHQAFVEITRFRFVHPGPPVLDLSDELCILPEYGNIKRDTRKAIGKIYKKFAQTSGGESIIAIWNDDEDMEDLEVEAAVDDLRHETALPSGLSFVIYGSKWVGHKQFYCFPLRYPVQQHHALWQKELGDSTVNQLIQRALEQAVP
jgi:hypothetical protein